MATALYRITGGEAIQISLNDQPFTGLYNPSIYGVLLDPSLPDGSDTFEIIGTTFGAPRQLGFAKFADVAGNIVRNATQEEIDVWAAAEQADTDIEDEQEVLLYVDTQPRFRRLAKAVMKVLRNWVRRNTNVSVNELIAEHNALRAQILNAGSFPNMQTRVGSNTNDVTVVNLQQDATDQQLIDILKAQVDRLD